MLDPSQITPELLQLFLGAQMQGQQPIGGMPNPPLPAMAVPRPPPFASPQPRDDAEVPPPAGGPDFGMASDFDTSPMAGLSNLAGVQLAQALPRAAGAIAAQGGMGGAVDPTYSGVVTDERAMPDAPMVSPEAGVGTPGPPAPVVPSGPAAVRPTVPGTTPRTGQRASPDDGISERALRNNNPGNIRRSASAWPGQRQDQTDPEFVQFDSPVQGIAAMVRNLDTYRDRHNLNTVAGIMARWSPANENETQRIVERVAQAMRVRSDQPIDTTNPETMANLVHAIALGEGRLAPNFGDLLPQGLALARNPQTAGVQMAGASGLPGAPDPSGGLAALAGAGGYDPAAAQLDRRKADARGREAGDRFNRDDQISTIRDLFFGMAAAGARPGATFAGSVGEGGAAATRNAEARRNRFQTTQAQERRDLRADQTLDASTARQAARDANPPNRFQAVTRTNPDGTTTVERFDRNSGDMQTIGQGSIGRPGAGAAAGGRAAVAPSRIREAEQLVERGVHPDFTTAYAAVRTGVGASDQAIRMRGISAVNGRKNASGLPAYTTPEQQAEALEGYLAAVRGDREAATEHFRAAGTPVPRDVGPGFWARNAPTFLGGMDTPAEGAPAAPAQRPGAAAPPAPTAGRAAQAAPAQSTGRADARQAAAMLAAARQRLNAIPAGPERDALRQQIIQTLRRAGVTSNP